MIDHDAARTSFATSLDFPLEPAQRDDLDAHLRECRDCRAYTTSMRNDATVLREIDFGPVPIAVRANVAIAAERAGRSAAVGRWMLLAAAGALLLVAIGGGALGVGGGRPSSGDPGASADPGANAQIVWKTDVVTLTARAFSILAGGKTFRAANPPNITLSSDPGDATYRTLEATWKENGVEMRLNLYFGGDATASWVDEIRIYNGAADAKWLYAKGPFFKTPVGAGWTGDKDITMTDNDGVGGMPAGIHFAGLTLMSRPFDGVNEPIGGGVPLPEGARPFAPGGPLHCSGILQMAPRDAEQVLIKLGFRLSWRLEWTTGPNTGYSQPSRMAPDGVIREEGLAGSDGELIMFVAKAGDPQAVPLPLPSDCPTSGPVLVPLLVASPAP